MKDTERELAEGEEQLNLLKEKISMASADRRLFTEKLEEIENEQARR